MAATLRTRPSLPQLAASTDRRQLGAKRAGVLEQSFYFLMSLLVAIVVLYGFSRTIETGLIHPPSPRPIVLYFHATIFTAWVVFFIMQSALVITRNVRIQFGFALGAAIPIVGVRTAIGHGEITVARGSHRHRSIPEPSSTWSRSACLSDSRCIGGRSRNCTGV